MRLSEIEARQSAEASGDSCDVGRKHDAEKDRWDLLPMEAIAQAVKVVTFGAEKYSPDNWRRVPEARRRYYAATMRHVHAWWMGEKTDKETCISHLAHAICCLAFLLAKDLEGEK